MGKFIRRVKLDTTLVDLFLSFLLKKNYQVAPLCETQEHLLSHISSSFLMSGFILNSCDFAKSQDGIVRSLKKQRMALCLKQMSVTNDLQNIARTLNEKNVNHVVLKGLALNLDGIYESGIRASRDIDLLVSEDSLLETYEIIKALGFRYINPNTQDSIRYRHGHHFPPMINEHNTKLELHWRVTPPRDFKNCPITEAALKNRKITRMNSDIFCPKIEVTLAHILYHGLVHHRMNLGPIFLFDLAAIFTFFNKSWPVDGKLLKNLKVEREFLLCKRLIELASDQLSFSEESRMLINKIFDGSHWLQLTGVSGLSESLIEYSAIESNSDDNVFLRLTEKIRKKRHFYQMSYLSIKFYFLLMNDVLRVMKKPSEKNSSRSKYWRL